jgi:hypothetical protein
LPARDAEEPSPSAIAGSDDGFILRSRASEPAAKTGTVFHTSVASIEIPPQSLVATQGQLVDRRTAILHAPGVWFGEEVRELTIFSEQYESPTKLRL